ncbi:MAG: glycosyltransferase family 2 protein [Chitinophagaceae bacterium]
MNKQVISIITCVYNGLPFLKECIDSVLEQNFSDWELLISDDGSSDGSRDYLRTLEDPRITVFFQEKNLGIFGNLNFLLKKASTPVAQLLCQDDYFTDAGSLRKIVEAWAASAEQTGIMRFNHSSIKNNQLEGFQKMIVPEKISAEESDLWFYTFGNIPGNLSNVSLKLDVLSKCGDFRQSLPYAGDFDFWARAAREYDMGVKQEKVIEVRRHPGAASNFLNKNGELIDQKRVILSSLYQNLSKKFPKDRVWLKIHGTFSFILQYNTAIKWRLKGKPEYWRAVSKVYKEADYVLPSVAMWLMFVLTAGGRMGRVSSAKKLLSLSRKTAL